MDSIGKDLFGKSSLEFGTFSEMPPDEYEYGSIYIYQPEEQSVEKSMRACCKIQATRPIILQMSTSCGCRGGAERSESSNRYLPGASLPLRMLLPYCTPAFLRGGSCGPAVMCFIWVAAGNNPAPAHRG